MTLTPTFSVIVPTHGRQALLDEALGSLLAQTFGDFECIVVDDASPEPVETPPDTRFQVVRHANRSGAAAARNTGLRRAVGAYVAFLDSDDLYTPRRLEGAQSAHVRAPLVICWQAFLGLPSRQSLGRRLEGDVHDHILDATTPSMGAVSLERARCVELNESYRACEDLDWWLRETSSVKVTTVPEVDYLVRRHEASEARKAESAVRAQFAYRLMDEHRDYFATHRRARSFRFLRIANLQRRGGDAHGALVAAWKSFRTRPSLRAGLAIVRALPMLAVGQSKR